MTTKLNIIPDNIICNEGGQLRSCAGPHATQAFALHTLLIGLRFEQQHGTGGLRLTRGPTMRARAKQRTGLRTNDYGRLIERVEALLAVEVAQCLVVNEEDGSDE